MSNMFKTSGLAAVAASIVVLTALPAGAAMPSMAGAEPPVPVGNPARAKLANVSSGSAASADHGPAGSASGPHEMVISRVVAAAADKPDGSAKEGSSGSSQAGAPTRFAIRMGEIDDLKSVYATVRSTDRIEARARIGGTIASLAVDEGTQVETGQVMAIVADQKLALKLKSLNAHIDGLKAQEENTRRDLGRQEELIKRGFTPKAKVDEQSTQLEVVQNQLKSAIAERDVVTRQVQEGEVLAPASGRVLLVPVTAGSVIMPGESLATIAANEYVLRLELPERHARFIKKGDVVQVGPRSLETSDTSLIKGAISQVYPELQSGRVIADASVEGLGNYFVGERVLVYISGGKRQGMVIPRDHVMTRYGYDFVRVARDGGTSDVVVQLGLGAELPGGANGVEVLGGLNPGDEIVKP